MHRFYGLDQAALDPYLLLRRLSETMTCLAVVQGS